VATGSSNHQKSPTVTSDGANEDWETASETNESQINNPLQNGGTDSIGDGDGRERPPRRGGGKTQNRPPKIGGGMLANRRIGTKPQNKGSRNNQKRDGEEEESNELSEKPSQSRKPQQNQKRIAGQKNVS